MRSTTSPACWRARAAFITLCYALLAPFALLALAGRIISRRRALVGLGEKLSGEAPSVQPGAVLLHGVSLGEVTLMRGLVPGLEAGGARVLLTTTTETGWTGLGRLFPGRDRTFLPFDLPWAVNRFLGRTRPRLVVLLENELWPLLIIACARRGIPVALVNARMSERSHRRLRLGGSLLAPLLASLSLVVARNGTYGARLLQLGVRRSRLVVHGSLKTSVVERSSQTEAANEGRRLDLPWPTGPASAHPILLLASTSAPEEELLLDACPPLLSAGLAGGAGGPRHPERGAELAASLAARGLSSARSSAGPCAQVAVLIVDEIGRLGPLYALTAASLGIAVVGGSLGSGRGGQNMLEAAAAGCCTVVGLDTRNQPESMLLLRQAQAVVECAPAAVPIELQALARDAERRRELGRRAQTAWLGARSSSQSTCTALLALYAQRRDGLAGRGADAACGHVATHAR